MFEPIKQQAGVTTIMSALPLFALHGSTHRKPSTGVAPRASVAKACTAACGGHRSESRIHHAARCCLSKQHSRGFALVSCPAAAVMDVHGVARARGEGGGEERQRHQARAPCLTDTLGKPRTDTCASHAPRLACIHRAPPRTLATSPDYAACNVIFCFVSTSRRPGSRTEIEAEGGQITRAVHAWFA
jgi:hypothetical protein